MINKFKKTLFGYNKAAVENEIENINQEFENEYRILVEELGKLEKEQNEIKQKIQDIDGSIASVKSIEPEIGRILAKAHLEASYELFNAVKKFRLIEKDRVQVIAEHRKKIEELDREIEKVMNNVQSIASM